MFNAPYPFRYIMTKRDENAQPHLTTRLYSFKSDKNRTYHVEIEEYVGHVFMVKFYLKAHRQSPLRYNLLTNLGAAQKIIYTVIHIMLNIFREFHDQKPSFAFMGSNTKYGDERADEQKANNKRFRTYKKIVSIFFGTETFEYIKDDNASILIMKNRDAIIDKEMTLIIQHIYKNYEILEINLISEDNK